MNLQDYYMTAELHEPPMFKNREFAIIKKSLQSPKNPAGIRRHLQFDNIQKLRAYLIAHSPDHVYFSTAKYENPKGYPMDVKKEGWMGSDLIFDIDDDHLSVPTIQEATFHFVMLKKVLVETFGLKDIMYTFSGSRGYHAHVRDESVQLLNNNERGQIVEYIAELGICIDEPVTADIARIIRLPGSIHGKTGKQCRIINPI